MLFQMLTGHLPYSGPNAMSILLQHRQSPIPSPLALRPDLPAAIEPVLRRVLAKDRMERYPTAAEFGVAIADVLGGAAVSASQLREAALTSMLRRVRADQTESDPDSKKTPSEQNKNVAALYARATDYAELIAEARGSEAVHGAMMALWKACQPLIEAQGGRIISQGDTELLVLWGMETAREDDTERAVRVALAMQTTLHSLAAELLSEGEPLPLSIGINSGLALLSPDATTNTIAASGHTLTLANRLMNSAEGTILVTHEVFRRTLGLFNMQPSEPLKVRGRADKIDVYQVLTAKPRAFHLSTPTVEGIETRQVGREAELKALHNALVSAIEDGETQVITVVGEAGLGKSRLLHEFDKLVELRPEQILVFQGRATSGMSDQAYGLIRSIMAFRCAIQDNDRVEGARKKMEAGIAELVGASPESAALIGYLCGFDFNDSPFIKDLLSDAPQLVSRGRQLFVRLITTLARQQPLTLTIEDMHWADGPSLDLLNEVFTADEHLHLVVIGTARPALFEQRPTWGSGQTVHHRLTLNVLDKRDCRDLVREILQKVPELSKAVYRLLSETRTANNCIPGTGGTGSATVTPGATTAPTFAPATNTPGGPTATPNLTGTPTNGGGQNPFWSTSFTYDPVGNRLTKTESGATTYYHYNLLDQLTCSGASQTLVNSYCGTSQTNYVYDPRGNLTNTLDPNPLNTTTYSWDARDRMTAATLPTGQTSGIRPIM